MSKPILGVDVSKLDLSISLLIDKKYYLFLLEKYNWKWSSVEHKLSVKSIYALQKNNCLGNYNADKRIKFVCRDLI